MLCGVVVVTCPVAVLSNHLAPLRVGLRGLGLGQQCAPAPLPGKERSWLLRSAWFRGLCSRQFSRLLVRGD